MHGENCAIPGCSISRKDKISYFQSVPSPNNSEGGRGIRYGRASVHGILLER